MKPRVIYSDWFLNLLTGGTNAIMLFPFIIIRKNFRGAVEGDIIINHESIHFEQAKELLVIGFYIMYGLYYLKNLVNGYDTYHSYRRMCFEMEAFHFQNDKDYLKERKPYFWRKL